MRIMLRPLYMENKLNVALEGSNIILSIILQRQEAKEIGLKLPGSPGFGIGTIMTFFQ